MASSCGTPCAACQYLRRKCPKSCVFAPHFPPSEHLKFECLHEVYGSSKLGKILNELPFDKRQEAVESLLYDAEARLRDPVYGCVGLISILQQRHKQIQHVLANAKKELSAYIGPRAMLPMFQPDMQQYMSRPQLQSQPQFIPSQLQSQQFMSRPQLQSEPQFIPSQPQSQQFMSRPPFVQMFDAVDAKEPQKEEMMYRAQFGNFDQSSSGLRTGIRMSSSLAPPTNNSYNTDQQLYHQNQHQQIFDAVSKEQEMKFFRAQEENFRSNNGSVAGKGFNQYMSHPPQSQQFMSRPPSVQSQQFIPRQSQTVDAVAREHHKEMFRAQFENFMPPPLQPQHHQRDYIQAQQLKAFNAAVSREQQNKEMLRAEIENFLSIPPQLHHNTSPINAISTGKMFMRDQQQQKFDAVRAVAIEQQNQMFRAGGSYNPRHQNQPRDETFRSNNGFESIPAGSVTITESTRLNSGDRTIARTSPSLAPPTNSSYQMFRGSNNPHHETQTPNFRL